LPTRPAPMRAPAPTQVFPGPPGNQPEAAVATLVKIAFGNCGMGGRGSARGNLRLQAKMSPPAPGSGEGLRVLNLAAGILVMDL